MGRYREYTGNGNGNGWPARNGNGRSAGNGNGRSAGNGLSPELAARLRALGQAMPPADIAELWVFPPLSHVEGSAEFVLFTLFLSGGARRVCGSRVTRNGGYRNGDGHGSRNGNGPARNGAPAFVAAAGVEAAGEAPAVVPAEAAPEGTAPGGALAEDASGGGVAVMEAGVIVQAEDEPAQEVHEYGSVPADRVAGLVERFRRRLGEDAEPRHVVIDGNLSAWKELVEAPDPA